MEHLARVKEENRGLGLLADLVHYRTYPAVKADRRKETRKEVITRVKKMHQTKFPWLSSEIEEVFRPVYDGLCVPSMRSLQFAGMPIFRSNARIYNCSYAALTEWKDFADLFWLLLNGVGVGYSVQQRHVSQLPVVSQGYFEVFRVPDSKEGWAEAVWRTLDNPLLECDFSSVRPRLSIISTGGVASGPEPLANALRRIKEILWRAAGRTLTTLEAFDIMCLLADIVVVGAVRRAATIALFDADDHEMSTAKAGEWFLDNPHRARANISAVVHRDRPEGIEQALTHTFASLSGEPGVVLTSDPDYGFNPCLEIALRNRGFCNLSEINAAACRTERDFLIAAHAAAAIGTLQASYTQFEFLHPDWRKNAEEEALLGVSITGQAMHWDMLTDAVLQEGAAIVRTANEQWAEKLEIRPAKRLTCTKPSGNTSAWSGTTSGIHAAHAPYYLRRVRVDRKDDLGQFLIEQFGEGEAEAGSFIETDKFNSENIVVTIPVNMTGAIMRTDETALQLLERAKHIYQHWVQPGHLDGPNTHNVSLTVSYKPEEIAEVTDWMVANRDYWTGISLLPYDGGHYIQAPFEEISEFEYHQWLRRVPQNIDFAEIEYCGETDNRAQEMACSGNGCEVA